MLYLIPNTSGQSLYTTAYEGRQRLTEAFDQYLIVFERNMGDTDYAFIGSVEPDYDNYRYTKFDIDTDDDDPTNGNILIPESVSGLFTYTIYGQNSETNLDPEDDTVVGVVEVGYLTVTNTETYYISSNIPIPEITVFDE